MRGRGQALARRRLIGWALAGAATLGLPACGRKPLQARPVPAGATVLALGDSLTYGTGADPADSYPAALQRLTGWRVINAGVAGDTAAQGLERLPSLLQTHAPALVLVGLGGNDLLRRQPEQPLQDTLRTLCSLVRQSGAQVLLIAVPKPTWLGAASGTLTDHPLYAQLAEEQKLPLQRQGWAEVLSDERLRSDAIHANARGYAQFAQSLRATALATGLWVKPS